MVRKDLGMVTAYAYAVSKGYTGTEEEFAELMASYATVAEAADASAQAAAGSASAAAGSATNASGSASAAAGSASAAASSASTASTNASESATSATAAAGSATTASTKAGEAASSASAAAQSATQAAGSASAAAQSATNANTAKTDAQTAKTAAETAQEKAEEAQAAAEAAAQTLVIDDTLTQANQAAEAKAVGDALKTKAEVDGYYQDMTVGDAEQLVSSQFVEDKAPYKFRTSGGSADVGNREYVDRVVGGTVAWNQLASLTDGTSTANGLTIVRDSAKGTVTINGTATDRTIAASPVGSAPVNVGDVILVTGCPTTGGWSTYNLLEGYGAFVDAGLGAVGKMTRTSLIMQVIVHKDVECNNLVFRPQVFNLTKMFGSTIADAIYAMNQATAGAGATWFRKLFPNDYYDYNAGELISVSGLQSHDMVGFNQLDEVWELGTIRPSTGENIDSQTQLRTKNYIRIINGEKYYINVPDNVFENGYLFFAMYDANKKFLGATLFNSANGWASHIFPGNNINASKAHYIRFWLHSSYGVTYKNDICINLSHNGSRNGEYEPYVKHSYPLDSTLTLRGVPKWADGKLTFDGDEYLPSGKVNRRYGVVDLGTLTWNYSTNHGNFFNANFVGIKDSFNFICTKYGRTTGVYTSNEDKAMNLTRWRFPNGEINIWDSEYTDAATFKAAMSGVYLVYELDTPTEETAEAFNEVQLVDDWGTEEYVSGTICPVGHETRYPANLRDKLQHLPDLASADGYYVVQQTGSQMSLVHFRIPQAPAADGTYTLKATVSGGVPTYTWEVVT